MCNTGHLDIFFSLYKRWVYIYDCGSVAQSASRVWTFGGVGGTITIWLIMGFFLVQTQCIPGYIICKVVVIFYGYVEIGYWSNWPWLCLEKGSSKLFLVSHVKITNNNQIIIQEGLTYIFVTDNVRVFQLEEMTWLSHHFSKKSARQKSLLFIAKYVISNQDFSAFFIDCSTASSYIKNRQILG